MDITRTPIKGVYLASTKRLVDERGQFARLFCRNDLAVAQAGRQICQIDHSVNTTIGTVRGLHYQRQPFAEAKWVRCIKGRIWDVAVDLRLGSQTFLQWYAMSSRPRTICVCSSPKAVPTDFRSLNPTVKFSTCTPALTTLPVKAA